MNYWKYDKYFLTIFSAVFYAGNSRRETIGYPNFFTKLRIISWHTVRIMYPLFPDFKMVREFCYRISIKNKGE
jgi:hypothetical protein